MCSLHATDGTASIGQVLSQRTLFGLNAEEKFASHVVQRNKSAMTYQMDKGLRLNARKPGQPTSGTTLNGSVRAPQVNTGLHAETGIA